MIFQAKRPKVLECWRTIWTLEQHESGQKVWSKLETAWGVLYYSRFSTRSFGHNPVSPLNDCVDRNMNQHTASVIKAFTKFGTQCNKLLYLKHCKKKYNAISPSPFASMWHEPALMSSVTFSLKHSSGFVLSLTQTQTAFVFALLLLELWALLLLSEPLCDKTV